MGLELDMKAVERGVIEDIADRLMNEDRLSEIVRKDIDSRISALFAERVEVQIVAAIDSAVNEGFDREYQAVDSFGSQVGDKTTIRKRLSKLTKEYWSARVDAHGKAKKDSYGTSMTRAEYTMVKACGEDFNKQLRQEAVNVTAALKDGLRKEFRQWIDTALGDLFKVRSTMDKDEGRRHG